MKKWIKENSAKRWANRFSEKRTSGVTDDLAASKLLVLKSTFDPAWDAFNIHELGYIIVKTWVHDIAAMRTRWTTLWNSGGGAIVSQPPNAATTWSDVAEYAGPTQVLAGSSAAGTKADGDGEDTAEPWLKFLRKAKTGRSYVVDRYLDVSKLGFTNAKWLVSRKKVRGLADILNKLKRDALDADSRLQELHSAAMETLPMDDIPETSGIHWFEDMDVISETI